MLLGVKDTGVAPSVVPMQNRGSLVYKFVNELAQIPILMKNQDKPIPKVRAVYFLHNHLVKDYMVDMIGL